MACYFEGRDESPVVLLDPVERYECDEVGDILAISPYVKYAEIDIEDFNGYKLKLYLPTVSPKMVLGAIENVGNPRDPVIAIGPVTKKIKTLPSVRNHDGYIDDKG